MDYSIENQPLEQLETDCIIVGIYTNQNLSPTAIAIDSAAHQIISNLIERGDIKGKNSETLLVSLIPNSNIERILLVGLGDERKLSYKLYLKALNAAIKAIKNKNFTTVACTLAEIEVLGVDVSLRTRKIVETFNSELYQITANKSIQPPAISLAHLQIVVDTEWNTAANAGLQQGLAISEGIELTKYLSDLAGNICTPTYLAQQAINVAKSVDGLSVNVLEESEMEALGMGALLSVSRGSRQPAKLICLHYQGDDSNSKPIVLVGKGLTFDAGGISLKSSSGMDEMKYDMCGGAAVIGTLQAAAKLKLPLNIIGLVPASENLPDGDANKPGDVVTSMSGKTIEILNTDAEGRLILCDTLTYAERFDPEVVIDLATLTGACLVALGRVPSGLLGNDDALCDDLIQAADTAADSVWRLPLWEEYQEQLKSNFADIANIGGRDAGTITAACFLSRFTKDFRWAHLDIAGTAWKTGANKGATGRPVALLTQYLINCAQKQHG